MQVSLIYILIVAELLLASLGLCITFAIMLLRKSRVKNSETPNNESDADSGSIDIGSSYVDFLDQEIQRNSTKVSQHINLENYEAQENLDSASTNSSDAESSPTPDEKQSQLLQAREQFLLIEKSAAEVSDHEIHYWDMIYNGMNGILDNLKTTETTLETTTETIIDKRNHALTKADTKEKVIFIESQRQKSNDEVDKLKDLIYEQANVLSSMKKAMQDAGSEFPDDSPAFLALNKQIMAMERQLNDSTMCTNILEMENQRLQDELEKIEEMCNSLSSNSKNEKSAEKDAVVDLEQMKEVVARQKETIQQLIDTIDKLEIDNSQADKIKAPLKDFTRTSQDMMGCIVILEEENERLQETIHREHDSEHSEDIDELKSKILSLEKELVAKDLDYALLEDKYAAIETKYLATQP